MYFIDNLLPSPSHRILPADIRGNGSNSFWSFRPLEQNKWERTSWSLDWARAEGSEGEEGKRNKLTDGNRYVFHWVAYAKLSEGAHFEGHTVVFFIFFCFLSVRIVRSLPPDEKGMQRVRFAESAVVCDSARCWFRMRSICDIKLHIMTNSIKWSCMKRLILVSENCAHGRTNVATFIRFGWETIRKICNNSIRFFRSSARCFSSACGQKGGNNNVGLFFVRFTAERERPNLNCKWRCGLNRSFLALMRSRAGAPCRRWIMSFWTVNVLHVA